MLKISNALYKLLHRKHIDWEAVKEVLDSNREYINEIEDDECSLSDSYHELYKRGRDALRLTQLFFDYGFDVSANEGRNGAFCLHQLCWGPYDEYILEIAEVLLEAGADISIGLDEDDERGLLDSISWKTGDWMTGAYEEANVNEAYYIMIKRVTEQKPYKGVRAFRSVVGATVKKIDRIIENPTMRGEEEEHVSYLIYTDKGILTINDFAEFVVNPYATEYAISKEDVSTRFDKIIGAKIKGLRFQKATQAKLSFDNGNALLVASRNDIKVDIDGEWVVLTNSDLIPLP